MKPRMSGMRSSGAPRSLNRRVDRQHANHGYASRDQEREQETVGRQSPCATMIVCADRPRHDRGCACAQSDRDARDYHQNGKTEAVRREFGITNPADEPRVDKALCHHRRDTEKHGHSHVDEVSTDRTLG